MELLIDRVRTPEGVIVVTTKTSFYSLFTRPRTYVIPEGFSATIGFEARYNTSDPRILRELHSFFVASVSVGEFQSMLAGAKIGQITFTPGFESLRPYIVGFNA